MRRRDRKRDEDETRRRFDAVWPAARSRPDSGVETWRRYDAKAEPPDESTMDGSRGDHATGGAPVAGDGDDPVRWSSLDASDGQRPRRGPDPTGAAGRSPLGAFDPGRRGIRVLVVVAVAVVAVAAFLAWRAQPHSEPVGPAPSFTPAPDQQRSSASGTIVVAVQGKVARPGLVRLPAGARVADAIEAAGGALPGVDLSYVNLARKLSDGELIVIGATPPPEAAGVDPTAGAKVNLNNAPLTALETLPGVGPALAQRIVDYRTQHGGFRSVEELRQVSGIGDAKFASVKDLVTV